MQIKLIIGLGNPGREYENTRHNMGFLFIDALAKQMSEVRLQKSPEVGLRVAKTQSFMNESGRSVTALIKFYKVKPENILIVHDDIDILWSKFKFSFGRSSAGHKGVESIIKALKTKNFWRLRIGIQPQKETRGKSQGIRIKADKIILKKFTSAELKTLSATIKKAVSQLEKAIPVS